MIILAIIGGAFIGWAARWVWETAKQCREM